MHPGTRQAMIGIMWEMKIFDSMGKAEKRILSMEIMIILTVALWSCMGPVELDCKITDYRSTLTGKEENAESQSHKSLYVTGVEYPEGINWRSGTGADTKAGILFLMKDGKRIIETDIGDDNFTSPDADMHRCIYGHLYTDFSTDMETVVKCDGTEVFRYFGREMIAGISVRDDGIYTLGQPRSGSGWSYRRNGETILYKGSGNLVSDLHADSGNLYFAYEDQIGSSSEPVSRYYLVENSIPSLIQTTDDVKRIDNVKMIDGSIYYIARLDKITPMVLFCGPDGKSYTMETGTGMQDCTLVHNSGKVFTHGQVLSGGRYEDRFWEDTGIASRVSYPAKAIGWCADKDKVYYAASASASGTGVIIFDGTVQATLPESYDFIFSDAIGADDGKYCAGLVNRTSGNRPALWIDGEITEYDFNGFFTSVSWW